MFIEKRIFYKTKKNGEQSKHYNAIYILKCDQCKNIFETNNIEKANRENHFCNLQCMGLAHKKDGILYKKFKQTFLQKYGVDHPMKIPQIVAQVAATNIERYGTSSPLLNPEIKKKTTAANLEKFGVEHHFQSEEIKNKIKETMIEKYGADHPQKCESIIEKTKQTCLERFGVEYAIAADEIKSQFNYKEMSLKAHETKKKNGTYGKSQEEDNLYNILLKHLNCEIIRQKYIETWAIDFYIPSLDVYINYNGAYYHGLDRPIEFLKISTSKKDQDIYQTVLRDQYRRDYFIANNIKFLEITSYDLRDLSEEEIINKILNL